ncbi:MAG TPA: hypothetical protein PK771_14725 [Spirochaetota bacterium]|nr:hypothetical protein [Spirochaetota bacterium]
MKRLLIYKISIIFLILFFSCDKKKDINDYISKKEIDNDLFVKNISVINRSEVTSGIYSDYKTASLKSFTIKDDIFTTAFVDKIYSASKISYDMEREFQYFYKNDTEYLFYIDYEKNNKQIFKSLSKKSTENSWIVHPQKIKPKDYAMFENYDKISALYYDDDLKFGILNDSEIEFISNIKIEIKNIKNINLLFNTSDNILNLFYINNDEELIMQKIKVTNIENTIVFDDIGKIKINDKIKLYDIKLYNNKVYCVYYKTKDYSLNIYSEKNSKSEKIGYFTDINSLNLFFNDNLSIIFYSCVNLNKSKKDEEKFYISMIFNKESFSSKKWSEDILMYSENPILSIFSFIDDEGLSIYTGGSFLNQIKIKKDFFTK